MTQKELDTVAFYLRKGLGYKKISRLTNLPQEAVKSYFRRNKADNALYTCLGCGKSIRQTEHRKKRLFCSDSCRMKWWNRHPELVNRKVTERSCRQCGRTFLTHKQSQLFCSRSCYADFRRKAVLHK